MIEDGKRGGITQVAKRRVIANNNEMLNYNPKKPLKYMIYVDANNLYGHAMTKKLPINGFKSIGETSQFTQEFTIIWILLIFLTVDIDYPSHLHDEHNDLPFLVEKWKIGKTNKLSTNLFNKKNYAIHTASLKQALDHRLIFNKVHKEIQFNKSNWLHPYIEHNNDLRAKATNEFD